MASSSSSSTSLPSTSSVNQLKYDVFLSFRGPDTRKGIVSELYNQLQRRGIVTFKDDHDLEVGDVISPALISAIEKSRFAIVVLSRTYAFSTWCLEELTKICECMEDQNKILPLFYDVEPSDVRYQKQSFEEAFSKLEASKRHQSKKLKQWRDALKKVATFSGWSTQNYKTHKELVDVIVDFLCSKVVPDVIEPIGDFQAFKTTRQAMYEVMKALKDDNVTVVGVYGMGGVGKTTLVKHVGAHARKNGIFNYVIICVVSQGPDYKKVQGTLANLLGVQLVAETEIGRADQLEGEIKKREKILIILDDIWQRIDLSEVGIPNYKELQKCRSKVLLTTRIKNVCHAMKCQETVTLNILSEQDSWTLFARNGGNCFKSIAFEDVARRVARECCGLPIASITVARALGDKELVEWKRAAQRLEKSQSANPDQEKDAFECLKLSYDYLNDEEYKSYFLLCCLFPEDSDIPIEELFRYAIGKGMFPYADTFGEAREKADSVITHLVHSCLLLKGEDRKTRCVRMHDVVRDTAIQIKQSEDGFLVRAGSGLKKWPHKLLKGYSAISLMGNDISELPKRLVCPKLQILLLNDIGFTTEIPKTFFQSPNDLRVLNLSYTHISLLPQSFSLLTGLQALHLNRCHIDISMIGELKRLEILTTRDSYLKKFKRAIGGLTNLKLLDMTNARIDTPLAFISKLHNLEELYMYRLKVDDDGEEAEAGLGAVTSLSNLTVLEVSICDAQRLPAYVEFNSNWVVFDIYIGAFDLTRASYRYGHRSISLKVDTISRLPEWFVNLVMNKAEWICWYGCRRLTDIFMESEHGRLQDLKHLSVHGDHDYEQMNTITSVPKELVFENLEELFLDGVYCLELFFGGLPHGSLFNLKLLDVRFCYNWGNVILPSGLLQKLQNLEELNCLSMEEIEYVFWYEAWFEPEQSKLRKIELDYLKTVRSICHGPAPLAMFRTLQSLSIKRCNLQGSLFTSDVAQCLSQLNYFELHNCPLLERIVEPSNQEIILPKLKHLHLKKLPLLYYESATFDIECPSLEQLELGGCPKFSVSLSDFQSKKHIQFQRYKG